MSVNVDFRFDIIYVETEVTKWISFYIYCYKLLTVLIGTQNLARAKTIKNWIAILDLKTCPICRTMHGKIWRIEEQPEVEPEVHPFCRCEIKIMKTVKAGTATTKGLDGADLTLKFESKLPDYYLTSAEAKANGWIPKLANLWVTCPDKMIFGGKYKNRNSHLPCKEGRIWYEADINYRIGYRNNQRVVYSNDGLIFVTYDHYKTFFEIV